MAKIEPVPPIPDVEDVWGVLRFLADAKGCEARLKALEDLRVAIDEKIAAVGKAEDIDGLHIQARGDRQMAAETLAGAKRDAEVLRREARVAVEAATATIGEMQDTLLKERQVFEADKREHQDAMGRREVAAMKAFKEGRDALEEGERRLAEAQALRAEFQTKLGKLQAAAAGVA